MNRISHWLHKFFMKHYLRSKLENRSKTGNIIAHIGLGSIGTPVRKYFVPEQVFVEIEENIAEEYGVEGREKLYRSGRRMGRRFNEISDFPRIDEVGKFKLKRFFNFFATYVETAFADSIDYQMDFDEKRLELKHKGMSVCRKSGIGEIFSKGVTAGAMSYLYNSDKMASHHEKCQGLGDEECHTIIKPHKDKMKIEEDEPLSEKYAEKNSGEQIDNSEGKSLKQMLKTEEYRFRDGKLEVQGERMMIQEICITYLVEDVFSTDREQEILFQSSKDGGEKTFNRIDNQFIENFLTATGWGIAEIDDKIIKIRHMPWTYLTNDSEFPILRGLISGMLTESEGEEVELRKYSYDEAENMLTIYR